MFYGTEADFLAYHTARGRDVSQWTTEQIETALLLSSEWIDAAFRERFCGVRISSAQVRDWPRTGVIDYWGYSVPSDRVPIAIENATYEAAHRTLQNPGALWPDNAVNKYKRVKVEGAIEVDYADTSGGLQTTMPVIGAILASLLPSTGSSAVSGRVYRV